MRLFTTATLVAVLLAFSGMALAQTPGTGPGQGKMGQGMMMHGQMPQMMEQMGQGKMNPEDQKKMADMMKSCPMMKMMEHHQKPEQPKK
jgi:hypothetical protein